jgi:hypothetical protein
MPKTCIICGQRARSKEHIFPAALGGRRKDKGIYCEPHNKGFSPLAAIITDQLKAINALLAVRPDRSGVRAKAFEYKSPTGEQLTIFNGSVKRTNPNQTQSQGKLQVHLTLGGPEGLRSIAYIALTFFAHHFQPYARHAELQPIKDFVLGTAQNEFVWWESVDVVKTLPPNPFEFGHTIVLVTSASTHEATALVSLFQSLHFGVSLGKIEGLADKSVVVFIDPHAEAPDDIKEDKHNSALLKLQKPEPLHAYLEKIVREGAGQHQLQLLLNKIERWKFKNDMLPFLDRLNAARSLAPALFFEEIKGVVEEQANRVYRLMQYVASEFAATQKNNTLMEPCVNLINATIEKDPTTSSGLSPLAEACTANAMGAIINELRTKLSQNEIDMNYLWEVFSAGYGKGIVREAIMSLIRQ